MFKFLIFKWLQFCIRLFPLSVSYRIADVLSDVQCAVSWKDRLAVVHNLQRIDPSRADRDHVRDVFRNFGRYLVEFFQMDRLADPVWINAHVQFEHVEYLHEAARAGQGVVMVTAHLSNWEFGGALLAHLGYPPVAIALPHRSERLNQLFNTMRAQQGIEVVSVRQAMKECPRRLREGRVVAVVAERDFNNRGEVMDFLNARALIPRGPAAFAVKTGAPIVPAFLLREGGGFRFVVYPAIWPEADDASNLTRLMKRYLASIEDCIKKHPSQWVMFREYALS